MSEENDFMLTTFDNPFNPFKEFERWLKQDILLGHDCCGTLAREANTSDTASDEINEKAIDEAMDFICKQEPLVYRKVRKEDYEKT